MTDLREAFAKVPEGCDVKIDIELVYGGWCLYLWLTPGAGAITPTGRGRLYARSEACETLVEAAAKFPEVLERAIKNQDWV